MSLSAALGLERHGRKSLQPLILWIDLNAGRLQGGDPEKRLSVVASKDDGALTISPMNSIGEAMASVQIDLCSIGEFVAFAALWAECQFSAIDCRVRSSPAT